MLRGFGGCLQGMDQGLCSGSAFKAKLQGILMKANWFWGLLGFLGILGYAMNEPTYYVFFVFFLFFLEPVVHRSKKGAKK